MNIETFENLLRSVQLRQRQARNLGNWKAFKEALADEQRLHEQYRTEHLNA